MGVPTGYFGPIERSGVWKPKAPGDPPDNALSAECTANWNSAEENPEVVSALVEDELANGFIREIPPDADLQELFPRGVAMNKLSLATSESRKPRLVMGGTCSGVNPACQISEKCFNPSPADVTACFDASTDHEDYISFVVDVKNAHKLVRVHPSERGLLVFKWSGRTFCYEVCYVGGTFPAYWWARVGGLFHRLLHLLIYVTHLGLLYVDDWLWHFLVAVAPFLAALSLALCVALGLPISWKKLQLGREVNWLGVVLDMGFRTWVLTDDKYAKSVKFLRWILASEDPYLRKKVETGVGLLNWEAHLFLFVRPYLYGFYSMLTQYSNTWVSASRNDLVDLADACNDRLVVVGTGAQIQGARPGWQILSIGGQGLSSPTDLRQHLPAAGQNVWVRCHNPRSKRVRNCDSAKFCAKVWLRLFFVLGEVSVVKTLPE